MTKALHITRATLALFALALVAPALPLSAQEGGFAWENGTEVGFVTTSGNASSTTFSLKSSLTGTGGANQFKIEVGGMRASSKVTTRTARGSASDFSIVKTTTTVESAANYHVRSRYDRDLGRAFAFGGAGWERNTFSGFEHRFSLVLGLGKTWVNRDSGRFKTDVGGTFTVQQDVSEEADGTDRFGGVRATIEGARTLTETTDLETTFVLDENLKNTDDLRFDWTTSISVALTEGLAFKTSYQLVFDNEPALISVPLFDTGGTPQGTVGVESAELDTFLMLSLVIKL